MASPQGGYPPQEGYGQPGYGSPGSPSQQPGVPVTGPASHPNVGGKKKRAYAGEAFEFGFGANAALGGQQQGGGAYGYMPQPQPQQAAGYPPATYGADPNQVAAAGYGQPAAAVGGYQPPVAGYTAPAPGVDQMTQQFGQMGMGTPQQIPQQAQAPRAVPLNQLYPTDLLTQPFNVAELDYPPPPIILPPNVSDPRHCCYSCPSADPDRRAYTPLLMLIAPLNTCAQR